MRPRPDFLKITAVRMKTVDAGVARAMSMLLGCAALQVADAASMFQSGMEDASSAPIEWQGDEFDDPRALNDFRRIWQTEHWPVDQLQQIDVATSQAGRLTLLPFASGWWEDYRAELTYKELSGDLIATTLIYPRNANGTGAPGSTLGGLPETEYSLGGLMLRPPRRDVEASNANWARGGESFVFLSMGAADLPGTYQFEDKTTRPAVGGETHSVSVRLITDAPNGANAAYLRLVRVGPHVIVMIQPVGGSPAGWQILRRFSRPDFPQTLQIGFVAYTDWASMRFCTYEFHNLNLLTQSCGAPPQAAQPDLRASFEFLRLTRPQVPAELVGANLSNPGAVTNAQLLGAFGFAP